MDNKTVRLLLGSLVCILLAFGAITWATSLMDSLFAYRSLLRDNPPAPGAALGEPLTRRVVFVLIDALREDTSRDAQVMPYLNQLRDQGAWALMHSQPPSYSEPGYSVLLTGAWPDLNDGPAMNLPYEEIHAFTQDNLFSAAQRAGLNTAVSGYYWFEKLIPQEAVGASFYTPGEDQIADQQVVEAAVPWLRDENYQLVLIHLDQIDYAGHHEGGPRDPRWNQAASRVDSLLDEIASELDFNLDTMLVVSDHGQIDPGGHGGHEAVTLLEPFVLVGAGVQPGFYGDMTMVDVAPTIATLLGTNLPGTSQGAVLLEMLTFPRERLQMLVEKTEGQQNRLLLAYQAALGVMDASKPMVDQNPLPSPGRVVEAYQQEINLIRESRLNAERLPRSILAALVAVIPAGILVWKRNRTAGWMLAGALLYVALFHVRYGLIDGNTYSLSSVTSAESLISYVVTTSLIAMAASWLVIVFALKLIRQAPSRAFELSLGFVFLVVYLVSLPILLSYALNGFIVRWTLPHFPSMFSAFLSVLQLLVVAAVGLLFAVLAALIAGLLRRSERQAAN